MFRLKRCAVVILFFINIVYSSTEICTSYTSCRCVLSPSSIIDLTSVGHIDLPRFHDVVFDDDCNFTELYSYNPCFAFDLTNSHTSKESGKTPCVGAAACITRPGLPDGTQPEEYAIGLQKYAKFGADGNNTYINYTVDGSSNVMFMVRLKCDMNSKKDLLELYQPHCGVNTAILELTSKCACPNGCITGSPESSSGGLSLGSKLLIAFFTILLAYLIVGVMWNFCNGAKGLELFPNTEFWNDLPTLVMEGVIFTCSCFSRKNSYGEV